MNKKMIISSLALFVCASVSPLAAKNFGTSDIPPISVSQKWLHSYEKFEDKAQYKFADWSSAVGIARSISVEEAKIIADENPEITFFFYTKGWQMVLEKEEGASRVFRHGDTVFFSGEPTWGSAPGLADGYVKR